MSVALEYVSTLICAQTWLEVTRVIAKRDGLVQTAQKVRAESVNNNFTNINSNHLFFFKSLKCFMIFTPYR